VKNGNAGEILKGTVNRVIIVADATNAGVGIHPGQDWILKWFCRRCGMADWQNAKQGQQHRNDFATVLIFKHNYFEVFVMPKLFPSSFHWDGHRLFRRTTVATFDGWCFKIIHGLYALFIRLKFGAGSLNCILIFRGIDDAMIHMENSPIQSFFLEVIGFQERMGIMYFAKADRITVAFNAVDHRFLLK
jgi:hypothetical protein